MRIQPVVEGHGEIEAVPVLLRRLLCEAQIFDVDVGRPIRKARSELATEEGLARAIALARLQPNCAAILVLFDGEEDCRRTWDRPRRIGRNQLLGTRLAPCASPIASTSPGSWQPWTRCSTRSLSRTLKPTRSRRFPETPRVECHVGCSAEATSRRRTSPRSAPSSASRTPTSAPDPSASWPPPSDSCWRPWTSPPPSGRLRHGALKTLEFSARAS